MCLWAVLLQPGVHSALIKMENRAKFTKSLHNGMIINHPSTRSLTGEGEQETPDNSLFEAVMFETVKAMCVQQYGEEKVSGTLQSHSILVKDASGGEMFSVYVQMKKDPILDLEMAHVSIDLHMIEYEFALEKTPMKGSALKRVKLSMANFLFISGQYISSVSDISDDLQATLGLYYEKNPDADDEGEGEERRLSVEEKHEGPVITKAPILSAFEIPFVDLKKQKVTVDDPEALANVERYLQEADHKALERRAPPRKLAKDLLEQGDYHYIQNRQGFHAQHRFFSQMYGSFYKLTSVSEVGENESKELKWEMLPSIPELGKVECTISIKSHTLIFELRHPSYKIEVRIAFPSKRNFFWNFTEAWNEAERFNKMIYNLNDPSQWGLFPDEKLHKTHINDVYNPNINHLTFRQEFDTLTNGATVVGESWSNNMIQYKHKDDKETDFWQMWIYDVQSSAVDKTLLKNETNFGDLGKGFKMGYYVSRLFNKFPLGLRQYPDNSMFNQHVLAIRYIQMQVEFVSRFKNFEIPIDNYNPFPVEALIYPKQDSIPDPSSPSQMEFKTIKHLRNLKNSPVVSNDNGKIKYMSQLCVIKTQRFEDKIYLDSAGEFNILPGKKGREVYRVDYCTYSVAMDAGKGGGEERRRSESEQGFLV